MYFGLTGKITHKFNDFIVLDVNNVSYQINVIHPQNFHLNKQMFVYIYHVINEKEEYLIGFENQKERETFVLLLNVKNIGPKTALNILSSTTPDLFLSAVKEKNIHFLKQLPRINNKIAQQIILDLNEQALSNLSYPSNNDITKYNQIYNALINLGFQKKEIENVLSKINFDDKSDNASLLKEALLKIKK